MRNACVIHTKMMKLRRMPSLMPPMPVWHRFDICHHQLLLIDPTTDLKLRQRQNSMKIEKSGGIERTSGAAASGK